jgi:hypothetical protein
MSGSRAITVIRRAVSRCERANELHRLAMGDLREACRVARAEGVSADDIARAAELSEQELGDLLAEPRSSSWREMPPRIGGM